MNDGLRARYDSEAGAQAYATKYDRRSRRLSHRREMNRLRWALDATGSDGGTFLDVPCGAGRLIPVLLERADRVTAVDRSAAMVRAAHEALTREVAGGRVLLGEGDASALQFPDRAFDTVVCWRLLHHLTDRALRLGVLHGLARTARRGVIVTFADATTWKARFQRLRGRNRRCQKLTPDEVRAEATESGLETIGIRRLSSPFSLLAVAALRPRPPGILPDGAGHVSK